MATYMGIFTTPVGNMAKSKKNLNCLKYYLLFNVFVFFCFCCKDK